MNGNSVIASVDVECDSDLCLNGDDSPIVSAVGDGRGFSVTSGGYIFTFIGRNYPLIRNVSSYWFGSVISASSHYWDQVSMNSYTGGDSACSWSWQGISIPAGKFVSVGILCRSGSFISDGPDLSISPDSMGLLVVVSTILNVTGSVISSVPSLLFDLLLVIDNDLNDIRYVARSLMFGSFAIPFRLSNGDLSFGWHNLTFYAVDIPYGRISSGCLFGLELVPDATVSASPAISLSPPVTVSFTPTSTVAASLTPRVTSSPAPTPSSLMPVRYGLAGLGYSFELWGLNGLSHITMSSSGFTTRMRISDVLSTVAQWDSPLVHNGVILTHNSTQVSDCTVLIVLKLVNGNSGSMSVDVESDTDLCISGISNSPRCDDIAQGRGFSVGSDSLRFSFILGNYPLIRPVSSYWFGSQNNRSSNYWNQVTFDSVIGLDSGCIWSWQGIMIAPGGVVTVGVLFRSGRFLDNGPELSIFRGPFESLIPVSEALNVNGSVISIVPGLVFDLLLVIDDDLNDIRFAQRSMVSGSFAFALALSSFGISLGSHNVTFYAVDDPYGRISSGVSFFVEVVISSTIAATGSAAASISLSALATGTIAASPFPSPTGLMPVRFGYADSGYSFELRASSFGVWMVRVKLRSHIMVLRLVFGFLVLLD
jgi:hypothetical protein